MNANERAARVRELVEMIAASAREMACAMTYDRHVDLERHESEHAAAVAELAALALLGAS